MIKWTDHLHQVHHLYYENECSIEEINCSKMKFKVILGAYRTNRTKLNAQLLKFMPQNEIEHCSPNLNLVKINLGD